MSHSIPVRDIVIVLNNPSDADMVSEKIHSMNEDADFLLGLGVSGIVVVDVQRCPHHTDKIVKSAWSLSPLLISDVILNQRRPS